MDSAAHKGMEGLPGARKVFGAGGFQIRDVLRDSEILAVIDAPAPT